MLKTSPMNLFPNCRSRRKEALIFLKYEPRYLGCYGVLNLLHLSPATCHLSP